MIDEAILKIKEALKLLCPDYDINGYQSTTLKELVEHFIKLGEVDSSISVLSYKESIQVDTLNSIVESIKNDLIEGGRNYLWHSDSPKNDYERGMLNVIRLIMHRVHCIYD